MLNVPIALGGVTVSIVTLADSDVPASVSPAAVPKVSFHL